jgi:hypothetical protein
MEARRIFFPRPKADAWKRTGLAIPGQEVRVANAMERSDRWADREQEAQGSKLTPMQADSGREPIAASIDEGGRGETGGICINE